MGSFAERGWPGEMRDSRSATGNCLGS